MFSCINCGAHVDELYRRYSPSVLKVVKCESCGELADKYIEYDPVIVLLDLVLLQKPAYRHLLYNSDFKAYWKLMIVLILGESFRIWSGQGGAATTTAALVADGPASDAAAAAESVEHPLFELFDRTSGLVVFQQGGRNFYYLLGHTSLSLAGFAASVLGVTELRWLILGARRPPKYRPANLIRALVIGGCAKLLGLLGIVWEHVASQPHQFLIYGYTLLCLLTAYSVVCESGRIGSLIGLAGGLLAHNYIYSLIPRLYLSTANMTLLQTQGH